MLSTKIGDPAKLIRLSARLGIICTILTDHTFLTALSDPSMEISLRQYGQIALISQKIAHAFGQNCSSPSGMIEPGMRMALVKLFNTEFLELQVKISQSWSPMVELNLIYARLQLFTFLLHDDATQVFEHTEFAMQCFNCLQRFLQITTTLQKGELKTLQNNHGTVSHAIIMVGLYVVRYIKYFTFIDSSQWSTMISTVYQVLVDCSTDKDDIFANAARYIYAVAKIESIPRGLKVKTRLSASLRYDTTGVLKRHRGTISKFFCNTRVESLII